MKITKSQLKQIIKEELSDTLGHKASRKLSRVGIAHESEDVRKEIMDMILALDTGDEQDAETLANMAAYLKDASAANVRQGLGLEEKKDHPGETCKQAHPTESHEKWEKTSLSPTLVVVEEEPIEYKEESVGRILEQILLEAGVSERIISKLDVLNVFEQWYEGPNTEEDVKDSIQSFKEAMGGTINAKLGKVK